jgi:hypothetical protein
VDISVLCGLVFVVIQGPKKDECWSITYNLSFRVSLSCAAEVEVQE